MTIGQKIKFCPTEWPTNKPPVEGTVIYVHPRSRFVLVEYQVVTMWGDLSVSLRECLPLTHGVADKGAIPKRGYHRNF